MARPYKDVVLTIIKDSSLPHEQKKLDEFSATFLKDPCYAFEWSDDVFRAAARVKVLAQLAKLVDEKGLETALSVAEREALKGARWPSRSTSVPANLIHREMASAWADFALEYGEAIRNETVPFLGLGEEK